MSRVCLDGLSSWWPGQDQAPLHCLDEDQVLMAMLSRHASTLHDSLLRRPSAGGGVTRLGASILLTAQPSPDGDGIVVVDPAQGRCVRLGFSAVAPRLPMRNVLRVLRTSPELVCFVPQPPCEATATFPTREALCRLFRFVCSEKTAGAAIDRLLAFFAGAGAGTLRPAALSVMLTGPSGSGTSHGVKALLAALPDCFSVSSGGQRQIMTVLTKRRLSLAALFESSFSSSAVAEGLVKVLRPPLVSCDEPLEGAAPRLLSVLVVHLQSAELLSASSDHAFLHVAAETLARIVSTWSDSQRAVNGCSRLLILSDVRDPTELHPVLRGQDALSMVRLPHGAPSERMRVELVRELLLGSAAAEAAGDEEVAFAAAHCLAKGATVSGVVAACRPGGPIETTLLTRRIRIEGSNSIANVGHEDAFRGVVGLQPIVQEMRRLLLSPLMNPRLLQGLGLRCPKGALLVGPTGCGKTLMCACLAKAVRHEASQSTMKVDVMLADCLTLIDKHVGQTEKNISAMFAAARSRAPCVLIIDNIDAVAPPRGRPLQESSSTGDRSLSTLLVEMDGVRPVAGSPVVVVASARAVDSLDAALCRPGRLDLVLQLPLPSPEALASLVTSTLELLVARRGSEATSALYGRTLAVMQEAAASGNGNLSFADASSIARAVVLDVAPERECSSGGDLPTVEAVMLSLRKHATNGE